VIYDKLAAGYDRAIAPLERRFLSRWREETLSLLPVKSAILEIGAGTGLNFRYYPECGHAIASEISIRMILLAKEKTDYISLVQADAQSLPFGHFGFLLDSRSRESFCRDQKGIKARWPPHPSRACPPGRFGRLFL
jgi:ubiquinone/menaquinone biosynthesis C-methylase UbiE